MESLQQVARKRWACAKMNSEFLCIDTYSGYRSCALDPEGKQHLLPIDAPDVAVGEALIDCLGHSRFLRPDELDAFFDYERSTRNYAEWMQRLMHRYGYKTKRALFKEMKNCYIEQREGRIVMQPTRHEKLEGWGRSQGDERLDIEVAAGSSAADVGKALRLALSRSVG